MAPPLAKNKFLIFFGICPTMVSSLSTAMAYLSKTLNGCLSHKRSSPIMTINPTIFVNVHSGFFVSYYVYISGKLHVLKIPG